MKKSQLGIEPPGVDFIIQSTPWTPAEEAEFSAFIAKRKKAYAARQKAAATRRATAVVKPHIIA